MVRLFVRLSLEAIPALRSRSPLVDLVAIMLMAALVMCVALAAIRSMQGHGLVDAFLSAVTLAVAALPEEFPVVFTFFLGVGVYRLARRQALVRRAVAVENIGRVTCICSDKTGTLTEGKLALSHQMSRRRTHRLSDSSTGRRLLRVPTAGIRSMSP